MTFAIEHNVIAIFGGKNDLENDVYLNDLHLLSLDTFTWLSVQSAGGKAPPRFNHSAAIYGMFFLLQTIGFLTTQPIFLFRF